MSLFFTSKQTSVMSNTDTNNNFFHFFRLLLTAKSNRILFLYWTCMSQISVPIKFLNFKRAPPPNERPIPGLDS